MPRDNSVLQGMFRSARMVQPPGTDGAMDGSPPVPNGAGRPATPAAGRMGGGQDVQRAYDQAQEALQVLADKDPRFGKVLEALDASWQEMSAGQAQAELGEGQSPKPPSDLARPLNYRGSAKSGDGGADDGTPPDDGSAPPDA